MTGWAAAVDDLDRALAAEGTPERAAQERRYLKSDLRHHGASMPAIRRVLKAWRGTLPPFDHASLRAFVEESWARLLAAAASRTRGRRGPSATRPA